MRVIYFLFLISLIWAGALRAEPADHGAPAYNPRLLPSFRATVCGQFFEDIRIRCKLAKNKVALEDSRYLQDLIRRGDELQCADKSTDPANLEILAALEFENAVHHPESSQTLVHDIDKFREILITVRLELMRGDVGSRNFALSNWLEKKSGGLSEPSLKRLAAYFKEAIDSEKHSLPMIVEQSLAHLPLFERSPITPLQNVCGALSEKHRGFIPDLKLSAIEAVAALSLQKLGPDELPTATKRVVARLTELDPAGLRLFSLRTLLLPHIQKLYPSSDYSFNNSHGSTTLAQRALASDLVSSLAPGFRHLDLPAVSGCEGACVMVARGNEPGKFKLVLPQDCRNPIPADAGGNLRTVFEKVGPELPTSLHSVPGTSVTPIYRAQSHATEVTVSLPISELESGKAWEDYTLEMRCGSENRTFQVHVPLKPGDLEVLAERQAVRASPPYDEFDADGVRSGIILVADGMRMDEKEVPKLEAQGFKCSTVPTDAKKTFLESLSSGSVDYVTGETGNSLGTNRIYEFTSPAIVFRCERTETRNGKPLRQKLLIIGRLYGGSTTPERLESFEVSSALKSSARKTPTLFVSSLPQAAEAMARFVAQNAKLGIEAIPNPGVGLIDDRFWMKELVASKSYAEIQKTIGPLYLTPGHPDYPAAHKKLFVDLWRKERDLSAQLRKRQTDPAGAGEEAARTGKIAPGLMVPGFNLSKWAKEVAAKHPEMSDADKENLLATAGQIDTIHYAQLGFQSGNDITKLGRGFAIEDVGGVTELNYLIKTFAAFEKFDEAEQRALLRAFPLPLTKVVLHKMQADAIPIYVTALATEFQGHEKRLIAQSLKRLAPLPTEARQRVMEAFVRETNPAVVPLLAALLGPEEKAAAHRYLMTHSSAADSGEPVAPANKVDALWGIDLNQYPTVTPLFSNLGASLDGPDYILSQLMFRLREPEKREFHQAALLLGATNYEPEHAVSRLNNVLAEVAKPGKKFDTFSPELALFRALGDYASRGNADAIQILENAARGNFKDGSAISYQHKQPIQSSALHELLRVKETQDRTAHLAAEVIEGGNSISRTDTLRGLKPETILEFAGALGKNTDPKYGRWARKDALEVLANQGEASLPALPQVLVALERKFQQKSENPTSAWTEYGAALRAIAAIGPKALPAAEPLVGKMLQEGTPEEKTEAAIAALRMKSKTLSKEATLLLRQRILSSEKKPSLPGYDFAREFESLRGIDESARRVLLQTLFTYQAKNTKLFVERATLIAALGADAAPAVRSALGDKNETLSKELAFEAALLNRELGSAVLQTVRKAAEGLDVSGTAAERWIKLENALAEKTPEENQKQATEETRRFIAKAKE